MISPFYSDNTEVEETKTPAQVHIAGKMQRNTKLLIALPHGLPPPGSPLGLHTCRGRASSGLSLTMCVCFHHHSLDVITLQPPGSSLCPLTRLVLG